MASVVMADDGIAFDGAMAETAPLGGAETAFVALAEALAGRGHRVEVRNRCAAALTHNGVRWAPLSADIPEACDLYIGNRGHRVIGLVRRAGRRLFWLHNPAGHLRKPRNLWRLARYRPLLVATGAYHAATIPAWLPCAGRRIIPYGVLDRLSPRDAARAAAAACDLYLEPVARARLAARSVGRADPPAVPGAELHIYAGGAVYGRAALPKAGTDGRDPGPRRHARRHRRAPLCPGRAPGAGGGIDRRARHALSRRPWRDLLPGPGRGAGDGRAGGGDIPWALSANGFATTSAGG